MQVSETCVLTFRTSLNNQKNVRINDPRPDLGASNAIVAAEQFMSTNVFDETVGNLEQLVRAEVVTTTTNVLI